MTAPSTVGCQAQADGEQLVLLLSYVLLYHVEDMLTKSATEGGSGAAATTTAAEGGNGAAMQTAGPLLGAAGLAALWFL